MRATGHQLDLPWRYLLACIAMSCALACGMGAMPRTAAAATSQELKQQLEDASVQFDNLMAQTDESVAALQETRALVDETQQLIDETRSTLDEKAKEVARMQDDLAVLIASDYKAQSNYGMLEFCLGATSFEDFVSRVYYVQRASEQKEQSIVELRTAQDEMMRVQSDLQDKKATLEELATQQEGQVGDLQAALASQQTYLDSLPSEIQAALEQENEERLKATQEEAEALVEEAESSTEEKDSDAEPPKSDEPEQGSETTPQNETSVPSQPSEPTEEEKTPQSQPNDSNGGDLADVANYIGPQASWSNDTSYLEAQRNLLISAGSSTNWGCVVHKGAGRCVVFRKDGGVWKAAMTTDVLMTGHTFTGTYSVAFHARACWRVPDGIDVNDWWVCFIEAWSRSDLNGHLRYVEGKGYDDGQGFHYGYHSGGCTVISNYDTAKWLYDHVPDGSRVIVY